MPEAGPFWHAPLAAMIAAGGEVRGEDLNWFDFGFGDHPRRGILEVGQRISGGSRALPATGTELPGGKTNAGSPGRNVHKN